MKADLRSPGLNLIYINNTRQQDHGKSGPQAACSLQSLRMYINVLNSLHQPLFY
jgi:hypothetical protein